MATGSIAERQEHSEGKVAKTIEDQTAKLPSDTFLWAAVGSMATSMTLQLMGNKHASLFVGQWAPTFLIFGLYNQAGEAARIRSDRARVLSACRSRRQAAPLFSLSPTTNRVGIGLPTAAHRT